MNTLNKIQRLFGVTLSREDLKNVSGGNVVCDNGSYCPPGYMCTEENLCVIDGGANPCVRACGTGGRGHLDPCVMTTCEPGICDFHSGIWGCG